MAEGEHPHHPSAASGGAKNRKALTITFALTTVYMIAEVAGGLVSNSLALLADAGHMLSDVAALGLSLFAIWLAQRPAGAQHTFGYYRVEIVAALANAASLVVIALIIFNEAYDRWADPPAVQGWLMMTVATGGLLINLIGLAVLHKGRSESLNVRGAWLHVMGDALGSVGAMVSGALILAFGWNRADPIASVLIGALILYSSLNLLRQAIHILMEGAPASCDVDEIRTALEQTLGVESVHDLHVWTITSGMACMSGHVVAEADADHQHLLSSLKSMLHERFDIDHVTIQIENDGFVELRVPY